MSKQRGFEVAKRFEDVAQLPVRSTGKSAGYDFTACYEVEIPSVWVQMFNFIQSTWKRDFVFDDKKVKPTLVPTGIKSYMQDDEFLALYNRSSNPMKNFLLLGNGVGVVDSDYYGNPDNDGHIMFQFINFGFKTKTIKAGDKIGQGIFQPFLKADNDQSEGERTGGFGSTGE
jgi:dUTP pyrophosphatase